MLEWLKLQTDKLILFVLIVGFAFFLAHASAHGNSELSRIMSHLVDEALGALLTLLTGRVAQKVANGNGNGNYAPPSVVYTTPVAAPPAPKG